MIMAMKKRKTKKKENQMIIINTIVCIFDVQKKQHHKTVPEIANKERY